MKSPHRGNGKGKLIEHIKDLLPDPQNARKHNPTNIGMIGDALQEVGAARSIVIDEKGMVLAGNGVLEAAEAVGITKLQVVDADGETIIAVRRSDLTAKQKKRLALFDNRTAELADWDGQVISDLLAEDEAILKGMFDADLLKKLIGGNGGPEDPGPQLDKAEELRIKWGVESGQLWKLGEHRLICGDCTDKAVVERVMGGEKAGMVMTSPPYWVGKEYEREKSWEEVLTFISSVSVLLTNSTRETGRIVINTGTAQIGRFRGHAEMSLLLDEWQRELRKNGWLLRHPRIWSKSGGLAGLVGPKSDVVDVHWEFIGTFYFPHKPFVGQRRAEASWANQGIWDDIRGNANQEGHCASFPVEIPSRNIRLYSDDSDSILDPFLGSGTTLIACERLGRKCYAVEIHPPYVAVSIQRWVDMTDKQPELINDQN